MQSLKSSILALLVIYQAVLIDARADVIELAARLESGRFVEGVNLTANQLSAGVSAEWSSDSGTFASLSCFTSENRLRVSIQSGCDGSVGWFTLVNDNHAITMAASRHDYSSPVLSGWDYTEASMSWHIGMANTLKLQLTDSLLGQGYAAATTSFQASRHLDDRWRLNFEAGLTSLQSAAPVNTLKYAIVGAEYNQGRWATQLKMMFSGSDYRRFVKLKLDQPEVSLSFRYRIY